MKKTHRLTQIKEIIASKKISNQKELLSLLSKKGFKLTQATLSRDLKELNIGVKYISGYGAVYFLPEKNNTKNDYSPNEINSIISLEISGNLAVIKTLPGFANSIAAIIDNKKIDTIIGTIAGDDTLLLIIKDAIRKGEFIDSIKNEFVNINILKP